MSLKYRRQKEKQNKELFDEEDKFQQQINRIYRPITWKVLRSGITIMTLQSNYYEEVLEIIKEYYITEDILCNNTEIWNDPASLDSYLKTILYCLKDNKSLIAIQEIKNEETEEITYEVVGFIVLAAMFKDSFSTVFYRQRMICGEAAKKVAEISNYISRKANLYDIFEANSFLQIFQLCIKPQYRRQGIGQQLLYCCVRVASSYQLPCLAGMFSTYSLQKYAKRVGMKVIYEILYTKWLNASKDFIFYDPGVGNYTYALMAMPIKLRRISKAPRKSMRRRTVSKT